MAQLIDGKAIAANIRARITSDVETLRQQTGVTPGLAVVLVGEDPASQIYVRNKHRACEGCGMKSFMHILPADTTQQQLLALIDQLNRDEQVHGILVQSPPPPHIDELAVIDAISPDKDVDGFHVKSAGALMVGQRGFVPCTPRGVIELIRSTGINMSGKHAVVIGRSNIVGKPVAMLLLRENCTVTICHSRTQNLAEITRQADILVVAIGKAGFVTGDMVKPGAIVIDVGINRVEGSKKVWGDVDFATAESVAGAITPVPGGVGPMTIAMLLENTLEAARRAAGC
nr:bifunctional methylenetetrahydrofolate dehydrogenase/methenyltetrahydrofolate cyclohydrolase FolD [bacterium]